MPADVTIRQATPDDAHAMAELVNMAGEGMPLYLWSKMAAEGQDAWAVGRERARREQGGFACRNTHMLELDGQVAACLVGYPLPDPPEVIDYDELPAMFVPLQQLEDQAPGTWYVNVVATYPEFRGQGLGSSLMQLAGRLADTSGCKGLSLVVADANEGARRLYSRLGFEEITTRPMVKEDWPGKGDSWVLMIQPAPH